MTISVTNGNLYFANRLNSDKWENASIDDRTKALAEAQATILALPFDTDLVTYDDDTDLPDLTLLPSNIENATYEQALYLLSGKNIDKEIKSSKIVRDKWSTIESEYRKDSPIQTYLLFGLLGMKVWLLVQPYLKDSQEITIARVN